LIPTHLRACSRFFLLSFILLSFCSTAVTAQDPDDETPGQGKPAKKLDLPRLREKWFYDQRSAPHGYIPAGARLQALQRLEEMRKAERVKLLDTQAAPSEKQAIAISTTVWTPIGPRPIDSVSLTGNSSGRVRAIAINPLNADEVYIGGAQGGVWRSMNGGVNWTPLTDNEASLAMGAIALDASTCSAAPGPPCQTIYAGTGEQGASSSIYYGAGILKTTNGGTSWTQLTGICAAGSPGGQPCPSFVGPFSVSTGGARIDSLVIQPGTSGNTAVLLAGVQVLISADTGTSSGIYRSANGGATWTQVIGGAMGTEVLFDPANPGNAYAALGSITGPPSDPENGIYKSIDGGATWTKLVLVAPVTSLNQGRTEIAIGPPVAPSTDGVLYASIASATNGSNTLLAVLKSTDGGTTWTASASGLATGHCNSQCWYDHVIKVHPSDPNVAYMGGSATNAANGGYIVRTIDGGNTWTPVGVGSLGNRPHVDIQSMALTTTRFYLGSDGGIWSTDVTNPQAPGANPLNWVNLNQDLQLTQFYPSPSFNPASADVGFGGTQDNGTLRFNGALLWTDVTCGDGGWTAVDPSNGNNVYSTCQNIDVRRSTNGGTSFSRIDNPNPLIASPILASDSGAFIPPFIIDNNAPTTLYFGTCRVWQTTNATAATPAWAAISPDLSGAGSPTGCPSTAADLKALALAPSNSNILYAGTADGRILRTVSAGTGVGALNTWVNITGGALPSALRSVSWIAVHPNDPDTVYVSYSGFSGNFPSGNDLAGHIFRVTIPGGSCTTPPQCTVTWVDISSSLPNTPVNAIVIDPANPNTLFLATDVGVFFATDANTAAPGWTTLVTGLPRVAVLGLALHAPSRTLRAATHGRGMWDLVVPTNASFAVTGITPSTAQAGSAGFVLTVDGIGFSATSVVRWNGANRVPNLTQSATQLTVNIPASDIANAGTATVTVFDPAQPAPSLTNARSFTITPAPPPNDPFAGAITIVGNPFTDSKDTTTATTDVGTPQPTPTVGCPSSFGYPGSGFFKSIWYRITPAANLTATVDTVGTVYDSVLSVYSGVALGALTQVDCDDDSAAPAGAGGASRLTNLALSAGVTYYFMVAGFDNSQSGATVFNFSFPSADVSVTLTDAPDPVLTGNNLTYTAVVSNAGPTASSGVTLTNVLPASVTFVSATSTVGTCINAAGTVTCSIGALNSGASATVTIVVTPGLAAAGTLNSTVNVTSTSFDPVAGNNQATTSTTVNVPQADLSVTLADAPDPLFTGNNLTYTAVITNLGPQPATAVTLTNPLPANTTFVSATSTVGTCVLGAGSTVNCTIGSLNSAATATVTIIVLPTAAAVGTANSTVTVAGAVNDPVPANNSASASTTVNLSQANLSVTLADAPDPVVASSNLTYTAVVSNAGPQPATATSLTYTLPAAVTFVSATSTAGTCAQAGGTVTCAIGTLNSAASATVTIVVTPGTGAVGTLNATVNVSSSTPDPNNANNSATTTTAVNDFSMAASPAAVTVTRGASATSTITVNALNGFTGTVSFTCTGLPTLSTCAFAPATVTGAAAPATTTLTITTTAGAFAPPATPVWRWPAPQRVWPLLLLTLVLTTARAFSSRRKRAWRRAFSLAGILLLVGLAASCGGGGSSTPPPPPGTTRGTFPVTVTGTSGTTIRTTTVTLTVN